MILNFSIVEQDPFPHVVLDDFLPVGVASSLAYEFPGVEWKGWERKSCDTSVKYHAKPFGAETEKVVGRLQLMAGFWGTLFGIPGLRNDPDLVGGGWYCIPKGGFLNTHVDFNHLGDYTRRLNLLLYLSPRWEPSWGGVLNLDGSLVEPRFNRCVVFETSEHSWHGHPEPLTCPDGEARRSIALYYYTSGIEGKSHGTLYR